MLPTTFHPIALVIFIYLLFLFMFSVCLYMPFERKSPQRHQIPHSWYIGSCELPNEGFVGFDHSASFPVPKLFPLTPVIIYLLEFLLYPCG